MAYGVRNGQEFKGMWGWALGNGQVFMDNGLGGRGNGQWALWSAHGQQI